MREWLWKALNEVILHGAYSNLYLKDHLDELPEKDQALAARIFYGTLQNYAYCQAMWKPYVTGKISGRLRVLLSMSCYQLHFLDKVPAYAIIDDAVRMVKKQSERQGAFVNAVLRKVQHAEIQLPEDPVARAALEYSLPEWLVRMWAAQYGIDAALQTARSSVETLPVYVRINPLKMTSETLQDALEKGLLQKDESGLYVYLGRALGRDPLYLQGCISAMDPGSYAIAAYTQVQPGERVLDLCAAPGTKTMAMAEQMDNTGYIRAQDLHAHRAALIAQDADRLGIKIVEAGVQDALAQPADQKYDLVLCDVPCSGYGVLARKPDMKLRIRPEDMDSLIPLQQAILEKGAACVDEGGRLVYSTCTLNKKENEKQVEAFLKSHPDFILDAQQTLMADARHDGFYMARLRRV